MKTRGPSWWPVLCICLCGVDTERCSYLSLAFTVDGRGHFIPRHSGMAGCVSSTARHDTRRITNDSKRRPVSPASHTAGVQYSKITTDRQHTVITRPLPMREILPFNTWNKYVQRVDGSFKRYTISGASSDAPRCSALHLAHLFSYSLSLLFSCRGKTQENVILQISRKQLRF